MYSLFYSQIVSLFCLLMIRNSSSFTTLHLDLIQNYEQHWKRKNTPLFIFVAISFSFCWISPFSIWFFFKNHCFRTRKNGNKREFLIFSPLFLLPSALSALSFSIITNLWIHNGICTLHYILRIILSEKMFKEYWKYIACAQCTMCVYIVCNI